MAVDLADEVDVFECFLNCIIVDVLRRDRCGGVSRGRGKERKHTALPVVHVNHDADVAK